MNAHTTPQALQVEELLQAARDRAPGLDDFGQDNYRQALQMLCTSLNTEAKLSAAGLVMMRERLVGQLVNRLIMEDYFKRFPEIHQIQIDDPLVIVGLPRTGTTMLQRTLAVDPRFYSAAWWETRYPAPLLGEGPQDAATRIELAKAEVAQTIEAIPQILSIHPMNATLCDEEFMLMEHSFLCAMDAYADVPSYTAWLDQQDQRPVYTQLKKMLQFLQWQKQQRGDIEHGLPQRQPARGPAFHGQTDDGRGEHDAYKARQRGVEYRRRHVALGDGRHGHRRGNGGRQGAQIQKPEHQPLGNHPAKGEFERDVEQRENDEGQGLHQQMQPDIGQPGHQGPGGQGQTMQEKDRENADVAGHVGVHRSAGCPEVRKGGRQKHRREHPRQKPVRRHLAQQFADHRSRSLLWVTVL